MPELVELSSADDLPGFFSDYSWSEVRVIGRGSNIILPDEPLSNTLVRFGGELSNFGAIKEDFWEDKDQGAPLLSLIAGLERSEVGSGGQLVFAFSGAPLVSLSRETALLGLSGLEFAAGIPGSVGGAVKMNAGAHGNEISEALDAVLLFSLKNGFYHRRKSELKISYRDGGIPGDSVVVGATFLLYHKGESETKEKRRSCLDYRRQTQPLTVPSAGSVFRNPGFVVESSPVSAGWLIEQAGLKGERIGGVAFSELHGNWLVRVDDSARAADAAELVALAKQRVLERFGVQLQEEIIFW